LGVTEVIDVLANWLEINLNKEIFPDYSELLSLVLVCISKIPLSREIIRRTKVLHIKLITIINMSAG